MNIDFHTKLVELRCYLREVHHPPLHRLTRSLTTFTQEDITSAVLRAHPHISPKGLEEYIKAWRHSQVSGQFCCSALTTMLFHLGASKGRSGDDYVRRQQWKRPIREGRTHRQGSDGISRAHSRWKVHPRHSHGPGGGRIIRAHSRWKIRQGRSKWQSKHGISRAYSRWKVH